MRRIAYFVVLNHLTRLIDGRSLIRIALAVPAKRPAMTNIIHRPEARGPAREADQAG